MSSGGVQSKYCFTGAQLSGALALVVLVGVGLTAFVLRYIATTSSNAQDASRASTGLAILCLIAVVLLLLVFLFSARWRSGAASAFFLVR